MGPGCLTAVFGMGTGVAIRVCSPGSRSAVFSFQFSVFRKNPTDGLAEHGKPTTEHCEGIKMAVAMVAFESSTESHQARHVGRGGDQCGEAFGC